MELKHVVIIREDKVYGAYDAEEDGDDCPHDAYFVATSSVCAKEEYGWKDKHGQTLGNASDESEHKREVIYEDGGCCYHDEVASAGGIVHEIG